MLDIAIFGTGSNGDRAWQAAAARTDINVVCFADNDEKKHGTTFWDRPVISAGELLNTRWDLIVIASMYAPQIREQLRGLGVADDLVVTAGASFADLFAGLAGRAAEGDSVLLDTGARLRKSELPSILILTYETLNSTHGTGVLLQRYFADFPAEKLFSVCHTATGQPWLTQSLVLPAVGSPSDRAASLASQLNAAGFTPDLIYATAFNELDLELLETVLRVSPAGTPVIQHFMDYMPHDAAAFDATYLAFGGKIADTWALTDGLARELERRYSRRVRLVTALHQAPSLQWKTTHPDAASEVRPLILGNLWQPWTLPVISRIWSQCRAAIPGLRPIDWYVHPARVQAIIDAGYEIGDDVVWRGFYSGNALHERLRQADLAIIPFNTTAYAEDGYTRFSLPSRLTELCGAGLPIFALASPDTEPARFLATRGCGIAATGVNETATARLLVDVLRNAETRQRLGARAREIAETEFALGPFQAELLGTLSRTASRATASAA